MSGYAIQSFSPRVHPINYDALVARDGCEAESGFNFFGILAFNRICLFRHDSGNYAFTQPDTVSYAIGPEQTGVSSKPFLTVWTAWVGSFGIRIGPIGRITPPANSEGSASALYPATIPAKLSHAFDDNGLLAIAIQKDETTIELKRYTNTEGTEATVQWTGKSAVLWYSGEALRGDPAQYDVACYYLRADQPTKLYGRFSSEGYATEHVIMPDLRAAPERLIGVTVLHSVAQLRFIDALGRDGTLYSPVYAVAVREPATLDLSFDNGLVFAAAVAGPEQDENATLAISFANGVYFDAVVETANQRDDGAATLDLAFDGGSYDLG